MLRCKFGYDNSDAIFSYVGSFVLWNIPNLDVVKIFFEGRNIGNCKGKI